MAIDFPSSPTIGQQYTYNGVTYTYSPQGVWTTAPPIGGGIIVSDSPPVGAPDNTMWWKSDTGVLYVRFNDGTSTQWVVAAPPGPQGPGGAWNLLSTLTAASSASLVFNLTGGYRRYKFLLDNIVAATAAAQFYLQVSEDGGATWKTAATYFNAANIINANSAPTGGMVSAMAAVEPFWSYDLAAPTGQGGCSEITLFNPAGGKAPFQFDSHLYNATAFYVINGRGMWYGDTGAINAVRFQFSSGNILSGTFSLYGITS